jgi:hypothetical protein
MARTLFPIMPPDRLEERRRVDASGVHAMKAIPWSMLSRFQDRAVSNHDQTLEELASRCGLSACEAVAILEDRPWHQMDEIDAYKRLHELFVAAAEAE